MSITVRKLAETDLEAFIGLRLAGLRSDPKAFGSDYETEAGMPRDAHLRRLGNGAVFGAFSGPALVAAVGYYLFGQSSMAHRGQVWGMIVAPEVRGQGAGRAVLSALIANARAMGLRQIHLGVGTYNAPAIALYQALGFSIYGTEPRALHIEDTYIDEHLMVLMLDKEENQ